MGQEPLFMSQRDRLIAWIEPSSDANFLAAFVGAAAAGSRAPATRRCGSAEEARRWVETEAAAFRLPVEWVDRAPARR
jgi:hypothetical protein